MTSFLTLCPPLCPISSSFDLLFIFWAFDLYVSTPWSKAQGPTRDLSCLWISFFLYFVFIYLLIMFNFILRNGLRRTSESLVTVIFALVPLSWSLSDSVSLLWPLHVSPFNSLIVLGLYHVLFLDLFDLLLLTLTSLGPYRAASFGRTNRIKHSKYQREENSVGETQSPLREGPSPCTPSWPLTPFSPLTSKIPFFANRSKIPYVSWVWYVPRPCPFPFEP